MNDLLLTNIYIQINNARDAPINVTIKKSMSRDEQLAELEKVLSIRRKYFACYHYPHGKRSDVPADVISTLEKDGYTVYTFDVCPCNSRTNYGCLCTKKEFNDGKWSCDIELRWTE